MFLKENWGCGWSWNFKPVMQTSISCSDIIPARESQNVMKLQFLTLGRKHFWAGFQLHQFRPKVHWIFSHKTGVSISATFGLLSLPEFENSFWFCWQSLNLAKARISATLGRYFSHLVSAHVLFLFSFLWDLCLLCLFHTFVLVQIYCSVIHFNTLLHYCSIWI